MDAEDTGAGTDVQRNIHNGAVVRQGLRKIAMRMEAFVCCQGFVICDSLATDGPLFGIYTLRGAQNHTFYVY